MFISLRILIPCYIFMFALFLQKRREETWLYTREKKTSNYFCSIDLICKHIHELRCFVCRIINHMSRCPEHTAQSQTIRRTMTRFVNIFHAICNTRTEPILDPLEKWNTVRNEMREKRFHICLLKRVCTHLNTNFIFKLKTSLSIANLPSFWTSNLSTLHLRTIWNTIFKWKKCFIWSLSRKYLQYFMDFQIL